MEIIEMPFFILLIVTIIPITIGIVIFTRVLSLFRNLIRKRREKETITLGDFGELLLFLVFFTVIVNIILYITGQQPDGFSIFAYLIEEMIPVTWYMLIIYGILIQLAILFGRSRSDSES